MLLLSVNISSIAENRNHPNLNKENNRINSILEHAYNVYSTNPNKSLELSRNAYNIARKNDLINLQLKAIKSIAESFVYLNDYNKAIRYYFISLEIATKISDNKEKTIALNNLGYLFTNINDSSQALHFINKAIEQKKYFSEDSIFSVPYNNLAIIYKLKGDFKNAIKYSLISTEISNRYNDNSSYAYALNTLGQLYTDTKLYEKALETLIKSRTVATAINNNNRINALIDISIIQIKIKELSKPSPILFKEIVKTDSLIKKEKIINAKEAIFKVYIDYFKAIEDFEQAMVYTNIQNIYRDSIKTVENNNFLSSCNIKFKETENQLLNYNNQINEYKSFKERVYKIYFVIIFIFIVITLLLIITRILKFKKIAIELKEKNTEIEKINDAYIKLNLNLENNITERNNELINNIKKLNVTRDNISIALNNANKANSIKDTFLSNIDQEIRTPLNAINGLTQLLDVEVTKEGTVTTIKYVNGIKQSVNRLLNMFNNIINFAKIDSNDINIELTSCDLSKLLNETFELYKFKANEKDIDFILDIQETDCVVADKKALSKVITDIFDNAIKFTDKGTIEISTSNIEDSNYVLIKVSDTGVGIENSKLPHLFDSISNQTDDNQGYGIIGLGLPFTKRLVSMMNGRIEISSMIGKGTTISVYLQSENKSSFKNETSLNRLTEIPDSILKQKEFDILIIEDDEFNQLFLNSLIDQIANPYVATESSDALNIIENKLKLNKKFDLIFMDINLPGKFNGIQLMHEIKRKWKVYEKVVFIAQTAYTVKKEKDKIINSGFNDYLSKPIDTKELVDKIKIHLLN